jgi:alkylhydroperoxidase/carboxymuconolactone decarboxylase family protein YurZ
MGDSALGKRRKQRVPHDSTEGMVNMKLLEMGSSGIIAGRASKPRMGQTQMISLKVAGGFYSPAEVLAKFLQDAFDKANRVNPVRTYPNRTGELANLSDQTAQLRSIAALFVKKYHLVCHQLAIYYAALRKRELTQEECLEIIAQVPKIGAQDKEKAVVEWIKILERGGEDVRTGYAGREEDDFGPGEEDPDGES